MNYAERLKYIRTRNLTTQNEIAKALEISRSLYNDYEHQYKLMPVKNLIGVSEYFNVSIDYILGLSEQENYSQEARKINEKKSGLRLKKFRKECNLSQKQFAKEFKIADTTVSSYETGKVFISSPTLYTICVKYNTSADWLLGKIDSPKFR